MLLGLGRLLLGAPDDQDSAPAVAGVALFCSASPSGNQGKSRDHPLAALMIPNCPFACSVTPAVPAILNALCMPLPAISQALPMYCRGLCQILQTKSMERNPAGMVCAALDAQICIRSGLHDRSCIAVAS